MKHTWLGAPSLVFVNLAGCGPTPAVHHPHVDVAPLSLAADQRMVEIPGGQFVAGSTPEERGAAYIDHERSAGTAVARDQGWFDREADRHLETLPTFRLDLLPVTQAQYAELVAVGGVESPAIDEATWRAQGFEHDYATEVVRFVWKDGRPPVGREDHPVVLLTWADADRYCRWRGSIAGNERRLPTALELEKAARGPSGMIYPWGNVFDPARVNSAIRGPRDTEPVGTRVDGASPFGVLDLAGNVFHWTATSSPAANGEIVVKGSAWDDFAGVGRGASWHDRPKDARHVLVGFRCAAGAL